MQDATDAMVDTATLGAQGTELTGKTMSGFGDVFLPGASSGADPTVSTVPPPCAVSTPPLHTLIPDKVYATPLGWSAEPLTDPPRTDRKRKLARHVSDGGTETRDGVTGEVLGNRDKAAEDIKTAISDYVTSVNHKGKQMATILNKHAEMVPADGVPRYRNLVARYDVLAKKMKSTWPKLVQQMVLFHYVQRHGTIE